MQKNAMLMPAVWGGLLIGVLSGLPFVNLANCCCCLWVIGGGAVAAHLLQSNTPEPITIGDGALVGLLAGLVGAVVQTLVSVPLNLLLGDVARRFLMDYANSAPDVPDNVRQLIDNLGSSIAFSVVGAIGGFLLWLFLGAVFAALGGLLGTALFKKKPVVVV